jgi:hypothetical protein
MSHVTNHARVHPGPYQFSLVATDRITLCEPSGFSISSDTAAHLLDHLFHNCQTLSQGNLPTGQMRAERVAALEESRLIL